MNLRSRQIECCGAHRAWHACDGLLAYPRMQPPRRARTAFTIVELLVVVAILGILISLLLPAVQAARASGRRMQCQHQLRQLALATHVYHDTHAVFPSGSDQSLFVNPPVYRCFSLFTYLLPFLEETQRSLQWELADPLLNTVGGPQAKTAAVINTFLCPDDLLEQNPILSSQGWYQALTSYGGNGGLRSYFLPSATVDGIFFTTGPASEPKVNQQQVRISEVIDGTSMTLLLGERSHTDPNFESFGTAGWCDPLSQWGWWAVSSGRKAVGHVTMSAYAPINYRLPFNFDTRNSVDPPITNAQVFQDYFDKRVCSWGSNHVGGANLALADGSVRFFNEQLPLVTLQALSTRAGGETATGN